MNFGDMAKNIGKEFLNKYLNKIKIIAVLIVVGMVMLVTILGAGDASNNSTTTSSGIFQDVDSSLIQYLLNFGGDGTIYEINGRNFYKSYDDGVGNVTVGLDIYIEGHKAGFSVSGYVSDTESGPAKKVNNVYEYVTNKFNNEGVCVYIEQELSDSCAAAIRDSKWELVNNLETSIGTTFSMQQKFALCAIYYRRNEYSR